eukprot:scaffold14127_cov140-Isochrysis_galbana.AAC.2
MSRVRAGRSAQLDSNSKNAPLVDELRAPSLMETVENKSQHIRLLLAYACGLTRDMPHGHQPATINVAQAGRCLHRRLPTA